MPLSSFIINENLTCNICGKSFVEFSPFVTFQCKQCKRKSIICPSCQSKNVNCDWCGGVYEKDEISKL